MELEELTAPPRPGPELTAGFGSYRVTWPLDQVTVRLEADRLRAHSDGRVTGRLTVVVELPGERSEELSRSVANLASTRSRRELARALEERWPLEEVGWDQILETACRLILEAEEHGEPAQELSSTENVNVDFLLEPLILTGLPTLVYAPGGGGKSLLALYLALLTHNGLPFFGRQVKQANTLYLDWEVTRDEAARRATLLRNGLERFLPGTKLRLPYYRRMTGPLADELSEVIKDIVRLNIGHAVIDSAGPACGGDILSAEVALRFFDSLRKLCAPTGAAAEVLTHCNKTDRQQDGQARLPIGSVYFENVPRLTWELRVQENESEDSLTLGLFPRKWNITRPEPLGLRFEFRPEAIYVTPAQVLDVVSEGRATQELILAELERGPLSVKEITEAIGTTPGVVRTLLWKLKKRGKVQSLGRGVWSLAEGGGQP